MDRFSRYLPKPKQAEAVEPLPETMPASVMEVTFKRFMMMLPTLGQIVGEVGDQLATQAIIVEVDAELVRTLKRWHDADLAALLVAEELVDWAIANAPVGLVMNLARVGLIE